MTSRPQQIFYFLGAMAYFVNFCIVTPFDIKLHFALKMTLTLLMLIFCFLQFQELIRQQKENKRRWLEASDEDKLKFREQRNFTIWMVVALLGVIVLLLVATYFSQ